MSSHQRQLAILSCLFIAGLLASFSSRAQTPPEALDERWAAVCAAADPDSDFYARCQDILNAGPGSGDRRSAAAIGNNLGIFAAQIKVARSGLARRGDKRRQTNEPIDDSLGLAGDDGDMLWQSERWGLFASLYGSDVKRNATANENAFRADHYGLQLGVDYRFSPSMLALISIGTRRNNARFAAGNGRMNEDGRNVSIGLYGTIGERFGWQLSVGRENLDYDIARQIRYTLVRNAGTADENTITVDAIANGQTGGRQTQASLGADWTWSHAAWTVRVDGGVDYSRVQVDPFSERNGAGLALTFGARDSRSNRGRVGLEFSTARSASWGVWVPYARIDWIHEFRDDGRLIAAYFSGDPTATRIRFRSDDPDRNFGNLSLGISAVRPNGWQWFAGLERSLANDILTETRINFGFRKSL